MFYIKSPAPFFRHPPEGTPTLPQTLPRRFSERGEGMCVYSPIPRGRDTPPPLFPLPPNPLPSRLYLWPPDPQPVKPRPCLMASASQPEQPTGIAQPGRGNTQKRHSSSRSPAAATKIFNDPLNLTGKGNCPPTELPPSAAAIHQPTASPAPFAVYLAIASNTLQMLCFAHVSSCFLALSRFLFAVSPSFATLPVEASIYIYTQRIYISLFGECAKY